VAPIYTARALVGNSYRGQCGSFTVAVTVFGCLGINPIWTTSSPNLILVFCKSIVEGINLILK